MTKKQARLPGVPSTLDPELLAAGMAMVEASDAESAARTKAEEARAGMQEVMRRKKQHTVRLEDMLPVRTITLNVIGEKFKVKVSRSVTKAADDEEHAE